MTQNIFIVGADPFNFHKIEAIEKSRDYAFHELLTFDQVKSGGRYPLFDQVLQQAEDVLSDFTGTIDAIVGYWDFPVNSMVPILCERRNLPSASVESELKCDHKYWSRQQQALSIPQHTPGFQALDPFDASAPEQISIPFPFWIKPIKATDSLLAFKVRNRKQLEYSLARIRRDIGHIGRSFNQLLRYGRVPDEIARIDGNHCIVEELIPGRQATVEGYVYRGDVRIHGVIDSINYPHTPSFFRYQYPSRLPRPVQEEMQDASRRIMRQIEFDNSAFNIEYFYDPGTGAIKLLEINPRISQSHSEIFEKVDGASNQEIMIELALGHEPDFPHRAGRYNCAAKFHVRRFSDGRVLRIPKPEDVRRVQERFPDTDVEIRVREGMWLSELIEQDSYSYDIAHIHMGARDQKELLTRYRQSLEMLDFEIEPGDQ